MKHTLSDNTNLTPNDILTLAKGFDKNGNLVIHKTSGLGKAILREAETIEANEILKALNKENKKRLKLGLPLQR